MSSRKPPRKYSRQVHEAICSAVRRGDQLQEAFRTAGVHRATGHEWLRLGREHPDRFSEYADLARDVDDARAAFTPAAKPKPSRPRRGVDGAKGARDLYGRRAGGFVYLADSPVWVGYKIGWSKTPTSRLRAWNAQPLIVLAGDLGLERELHLEFAELRIPDVPGRGEFFFRDARIVSRFEELAVVSPEATSERASAQTTLF